MTGYYDALLVLLPVSLFGLSGALHAAGVGLVPSLTLGGLVATGLTAHGLFVNEPVANAPAPDDRSDAAFDAAD